MKKYILHLTEANYIEILEEQFNQLENILIEDKDDNKIYQGKEFYTNVLNKELPIQLVVPIENFEVIEE